MNVGNKCCHAFTLCNEVVLFRIVDVAETAKVQSIFIKVHVEWIDAALPLGLPVGPVGTDGDVRGRDGGAHFSLGLLLLLLLQLLLLNLLLRVVVRPALVVPVVVLMLVLAGGELLGSADLVQYAQHLRIKPERYDTCLKSDVS